MVDQFKDLKFDAFIKDRFYQCMVDGDFIQALAFLKEKYNSNSAGRKAAIKTHG